MFQGTRPGRGTRRHPATSSRTERTACCLRLPEPVADYTLTSSDGAPVLLSELFGDKDELIVANAEGKECVCRLSADGFAGALPHSDDRAAFLLTSPDSPDVQLAFAAFRGWPFRMVSTQGSTFAVDLGYADPVGQWLRPDFSAFHKNASGEIVRTGHDEFGPGDVYTPPVAFLRFTCGWCGGLGPEIHLPTQTGNQSPLNTNCNTS